MRRMAIACLVSVALCAAETALAQDATTPKVDPARIDDVPVQSGETFEQALARFDNFSWRAFIALNWPSQQGDANRGLPDTTKKFGDAGARVWETYKARYEVFAPGAPKPANWDQYDGTNPCGGAVTNRTKTLSAFSHFADFNQAAFALGQLANPLIDQNRTYTRYEVRFNREQFDSIFDNQWYIKSKQPTPERPGVFKFGSIEIKAAWRVLKSGDNVKRERYYVTKAFVFDPEATTNTGSVACSEQDVALVGFHIVIKTPARPQWIWTTFEHVDNVPPAGTGDAREPDAKDVPVPYTYNSGNPSQPAMPNPAPKAITKDNYVANPDPMQVVRLRKVLPETMALNRAYWALPEIKGTIWQNYMLVMTQWPSVPAVPAGTPPIEYAGAPFPTVPFKQSNLANTTMETYAQKKPSGTCMECHQEVANAQGTDFVAFMLLDVIEPTQRAIASAVVPRLVPSISAAKKGAARARAPARTALDDEPAIKALVKMLSSR
jgi:hypothetical protein